MRARHTPRGIAIVIFGIGLITAACGAGEVAPAVPTIRDGAPLTPDGVYLPLEATATPDGDPIFRDGRRPSGITGPVAGWLTNWSVRIVDPSEITVVLGRDSIRSTDDPPFRAVAAVDESLAEDHPVIQVGVNGDVRAFPLGMFMFHEIVNTVIGGTAVAVTFCPLCNSAIAFDRTIQGQVVEFGVSGMLRKSDLIMYDRTTETLFQQVTGQAIQGALVGLTLNAIPAPVMSWGEFKRAFPDGLVLAPDGRLSYGDYENPYPKYDSGRPSTRFFPDDPDPRLPPTERVVALDIENGVAYPFSFLQSVRVVNDRPGGREIAVFWIPGTASALDTSIIAEGRDVGASAVFLRNLDGRTLSFIPNPDDPRTFLDEQTGSTWNIVGQAVAGQLSGSQLERVVHGDHFWFAWAAFFPDTDLVTG